MNDKSELSGCLLYHLSVGLRGCETWQALPDRLGMQRIESQFKLWNGRKHMRNPALAKDRRRRTLRLPIARVRRGLGLVIPV
jgi:hypothetical protein